MKRSRRDGHLGGGSDTAPPESDPSTGLLAEVRRVQPHTAAKAYSCPGCNQVIARGIGHVVVVPLGSPDERRHWHSACWAHREARRPGR